MLYDPKWEVETKADPFSLESLIAWLETQDPNTEYEWTDCSGGCLIGRYFTAKGIVEHVPYQMVFQSLSDYGEVCSSLSGPTTFGAALERARVIAAKV